MTVETFKIIQIRSPIRRHHNQRRTLIGLRLNRIGRVAEVPNTQATWGMIAKVSHLVRVLNPEKFGDRRLHTRLPPISPLLSNLFGIARAKYRAENEVWVLASHRLSGRFNLPTAAPSIQRVGDVDILLRCLEDEFNAKRDTPGVDMSFHYQVIFSETWILECYEILRAFQQRDREATAAAKPTSGVSEQDNFKSIFNDFELLRIPIAKFEIAKDNKILQPLAMRRVGDDGSKPIEFYDPEDPARFHIMPRGLSPRGSLVWQALDVRNSREYWVERRDLADRLLDFAKSIKGEGELEAERRAASASQTNARQ